MKASFLLYRRLLGTALPYWKVMALSVLAMIAAAALEPAMPTLLKSLVDKSMIAKDPVSAWRLPLLLLLAFLGKGLTEYIATVASQWVSNKAVADLRQQVFVHQMDLPLSVHQSEPPGRMLSRILNDIPQVGQALSTAWIIVIRDTLVIIGLVGYLFYSAWELTLLIIGVAPVVAWIVRAASSRLRHSNRDMQEINGQLTGMVDASLLGVREIKIFGARDYEASRFHVVADRLRKETMRAVRISSVNVPLVQVLAAAAVSGVIYVATSLSANDRLTPGEFIGFVTAMSMLFEPIRRLTNVNATIQSGLAGAQSIFELIDTPPEPELPAGPCESLPAEQALGQICFEHVRFRYPGQKDWAVDDLTLEIPAGQTVALVGSSGSGKTSVASLLARFFNPEEGRILVDGVAIDALPLSQWREQIAFVGQQVVLFDDSVAANIAYGRPDIAREQIEQAARAAHALEFVERLPQGLDTPIGENGARLSGGQRQRIAIARAFLKNAPVLILDEATSALDTESERQVQAALGQLARGRSTLVIAHRLSTIEAADKIVVMDKGRIVEQGRHSELLARDGAYARLYRMQFHGEVSR
jgi:ATP-binding cassette, subfamily B, bacterial MsbA